MFPTFIKTFSRKKQISNKEFSNLIWGDGLPVFNPRFPTLETDLLACFPCSKKDFEDNCICTAHHQRSAYLLRHRRHHTDRLPFRSRKYSEQGELVQTDDVSRRGTLERSQTPPLYSAVLWRASALQQYSATLWVLSIKHKLLWNVNRCSTRTWIKIFVSFEKELSVSTRIMCSVNAIQYLIPFSRGISFERYRCKRNVDA